MNNLELPEGLKNKYIKIDNTLKIKHYLKLFNKKNPKKNTHYSCYLLLIILLFIIMYLLYNFRLIRC